MKNILSLILASICFSSYAQLVVDYSLVSNTATQIVLKAELSSPSTDPTRKLAGFTTALTVSPSGAIPGTNAPIWVEGSTFAGLNNPVPSRTASIIRATQAPIAEAGSILVPSTLTEYALITINASSPISYPVTITPASTGSPNTQALVYVDGAGSSTAISLAAGTITSPDAPAGIIIAAPLPIKLNDFDAAALGKRNIINWSTSSEYNNDVQIVEASKDGVAGWRQVAKVKSKNSWDGASYEAFDNNPGLLTYYRIHSVDLDGREEFSEVISVQRESIITSRLRGISPTPANDVLNLDLEIASDMNVEYRIIDAAGKVVAANTVSLTQGNNVQTINIATLSSGSYTVILSGDDLVATEQFVKQ